MYQLIADIHDSQSGITHKSNTLKRLADNAFIPFDPANTDYQEYLEWLAEGNEPLPAEAS